MSNIAIYSNALQVRGSDNTMRPYDIVLSGPGINGAIQDPRIIQAVTDLFLKTVAAANQLEPQNISERALNATVLKINARNEAFVKIDQEVRIASDINIGTLTPQAQQLSRLVNQVAITAHNTIFAIRDLQRTENVEARVNFRRRRRRASLPLMPLPNPSKDFPRTARRRQRAQPGNSDPILRARVGGKIPTGRKT